MTTSINERLAVVEVQVEQLIEDGGRREEKQDTILEELKALREELNRYKGFLGGIAFVLSCLGVFFYKFAMPLYNMVMRVKGNG